MARATNADKYHHGDLNNALRRAAADLITERGAAGFSLREVARRAGVSHAAPAHHFGDTRGLLTAVATDAFRVLHATMIAAIEEIDDPVDRLAALGRAYVEVSHSNPGHCAVVFRHDLIDPDDPGYRDWGNRAYGRLRDTVEEVAAAINPDLDVHTATRLCWATMQGLVQLHPNMEAAAEYSDGSPVPELGDQAEAFTRMLVAGLRAC